jgi:diadenosine tetraphosphatase ApaH/serine/threonine PP2A family protein phosphatase
MQRTIVVGDVHGCAEELRLLLRKCGHTQGDRVVLAGDLVAKGPDSQGVVQFARENGVLAVLGNHDAFALAHKHEADRGRSLDRRSYLRSLGAEDWAYLEALPPYLRLGEVRPGGPDVMVVHAGLVPGIRLEDQRQEHLRTLRSIADTGEPTSRLLVHSPWAAQWHGPEWVIFGHDAVRGLQQRPLATGLDTGCVYGRQLTAMVLPEGRLVQVSALRRYAGK